AMFMQASMKPCARVFEGFTNSLETLRIGPSCQVLNPGLGTFNEGQKVSGRLRREEFLSWDARIDRGGMCLDFEFPRRRGPQPASTTRRQPGRSRNVHRFIQYHFPGPCTFFARSYHSSVQNNFQAMDRDEAFRFGPDLQRTSTHTQHDLIARDVAVGVED